MSTQKQIDQVLLKVVMQLPFFAPGAMRLPVIWDPAIPTACTDGKEIRWNPKWFDTLSEQERVTVFCHEVSHCMLGHLWRKPAGAEMGDWNIACDHAVNLMLKEFSETVTAQRLADPFPFPKGDFYMDPQFKNLAEEVIWSRLPKKPPGGGGGKGGHVPSFGEFVDGKDPAIDPKAAKDLQADWDNTTIQANEIAKKRGKSPAGLDKRVKELTETEIPWYQLVSQWLREQAADDYNWMKPNKLFSDSELILPILESERIGPIVFARDTSGSIDDEINSHFQSEQQSCLDDLRPSRLVDIQCDAAIQKVSEYNPGDVISVDIKGGGGTDFRPVFEYVEKMAEQPKCLVYLTDLYGEFPDKAPDYPVLWVTWTKDTQAPFGQTVYAKAGQ